MQSSPIKQVRDQQRRGAALVEFAVVCPILLMLVLGTIELGTAMRASMILNSAVREGGRLASMDFTDTLSANETANQKVAKDIQNFITASGLDGSKVVVSLKHVEGASEGQTFDLEDDGNNLELFRVHADLEYKWISLFPVNYMQGKTIKASGVFRAARSSLAN